MPEPSVRVMLQYLLSVTRLGTLMSGKLPFNTVSLFIRGVQFTLILLGKSVSSLRSFARPASSLIVKAEK